MRWAAILAVVLATAAGHAAAQAPETAARPVTRPGPAGEALTAGPRPNPRPFFVLVTGARATGQTLAAPDPAPLLPLPLTAALPPGPLMPLWPGVGADGAARAVRGPLAILAPVAEPTGRLASQEARLRDAAQVSVDVARLSRLFAATQSGAARIARPQGTVPDATVLRQGMARPDLRPAARPGSAFVPPASVPPASVPPASVPPASVPPASVPATAPGGASEAEEPPIRPDLRPQARPERPDRAAIVPLGGTVRGPYAVFAAPDVSPLATPVALRPPQRPAGITAAYEAARAERARGAVCGSPEIQGRAIDPIGQGGGCGLASPVRITSVGGVALSTPSIMDCQTAQALNRWVAQGAEPAVGNTGGGLASLRIIGHYSCRTRNNAPGARLSEHAKGRAVDIAGIGLRNGNAISLLNGWNSATHGDMLRQMHRSACGIFGTVLGPNANAAHRDHFHFDTARYRSGSFCR